MSNFKKYDFINFFRFICCILVVTIHTVTKEQYLGYFIRTSARVAVPFFFICSGYFLYNKLYEKDMELRKKYIYKYVKKIFNIYLFWSIIYLIIYYKNYFCYNNIIKSIVYIIRDFLFVGTSTHLWYLSALCVSTILLYKLICIIKLKYIFILSIVLYIFSLSADMYYGLFVNTIYGKILSVYINCFGDVWSSYAQGLIFMVMGIYIKKYSIESKIKKPIIIVIISYILFILENFIVKYLNLPKDNNTSILLLILTPSIFITLLKLESKNNINFIKKYSNIFKNISLTVYVIHPLVIFIMLKLLKLISFNQNSIYYTYVLFILVSIASTLIAVLKEKFKRIDKLEKYKDIKLYIR